MLLRENPFFSLRDSVSYCLSRSNTFCHRGSASPSLGDFATILHLRVQQHETDALMALVLWIATFVAFDYT